MAFAFFMRWLTRARVQRADLRVILYTRASCALCDEAWEVLRSHQARYGFVLETKNVDEIKELVHAFGACVPVVTINGTVRFRGHVNEVLLRRLLEAKIA